MPKEKPRMEFRFYEIPKGDYVLAKLGKGWEQEYGIGLAGITEEPEGTFVYRNKLMVVTCVPGNIYYVSDFVKK